MLHVLIIFLHPYVQSQYLFYLAEQYSAQFSIKTAAVNKMELIFFNIWDLYISYRKKNPLKMSHKCLR